MSVEQMGLGMGNSARSTWTWTLTLTEKERRRSWSRSGMFRVLVFLPPLCFLSFLCVFCYVECLTDNLRAGNRIRQNAQAHLPQVPHRFCPQINSIIGLFLFYPSFFPSFASLILATFDFCRAQREKAHHLAASAHNQILRHT